MGDKQHLVVEIKWQDLSKQDIKTILRKLRMKSTVTGLKGQFQYIIVARSCPEVEEKSDEHIFDIQQLYNAVI